MKPILSEQQAMKAFLPWADNGNGHPMQFSAANILYRYYDLFKHRRTLVEIGTGQGASAAIFASWGLKVHTFDVTEHWPVVDLIKAWPSVTRHIIRDREEIQAILDHIGFDCAFIDAARDYDSVRGNWELVNRCGLVLFHDYDSLQSPGVVQLVDEICGVGQDCSALWSQEQK